MMFTLAIMLQRGPLLSTIGRAPDSQRIPGFRLIQSFYMVKPNFWVHIAIHSFNVGNLACDARCSSEREADSQA